MRENEPVLLVLSVCDGEIILENDEILCEKRHEGYSLWRGKRPRSIATATAEARESTPNLV